MTSGSNIICEVSGQLKAIASFIYQTDSEQRKSTSCRRCELIAYFSAAWYLAIHGESMFPDRIFADQTGPSVDGFPTRDDLLLQQSAGSSIDDRAERLLFATCKSLAPMSTKDIERSCTALKSPWAIARIGIPANSRATIYPEIMKRNIWLTAGEEIGALSS
jgi:uncharacterized phage-associated protein